jgi:hypothetical protein
MEKSNQLPTESRATEAKERKPWHAPEVRVVSVPGVTANGPHGLSANDGVTSCS